MIKYWEPLDVAGGGGGAWWWKWRRTVVCSCRYKICWFFRCRYYKMNALRANARCFRDTLHPGRHISLVYLWKCIKNTFFWWCELLLSCLLDVSELFVPVPEAQTWITICMYVCIYIYINMYLLIFTCVYATFTKRQGRTWYMHWLIKWYVSHHKLTQTQYANIYTSKWHTYSRI